MFRDGGLRTVHRMHYTQAVEAGATKEEISEALAISISISAGSKRAKYGPVVERLEKSQT